MFTQLNRPLVLWFSGKMTSQTVPGFIVELSVKNTADRTKKEKIALSLFTVCVVLLSVAIIKSAVYPNGMIPYQINMY